MSAEITIAIISVLGAMLGYIVLDLLNRKKKKEETKGIVVEQFEKLTEAQVKRIDYLEKQNEVMRKDNDECEWKHQVSELEMELIKKKISFQSIPKETVFILDDNLMVISEFKMRFSKVSALDYRTFTRTEIFLTAAQAEKPEILIIDCLLDGENTAETVIDQLGYEPKIIIMSADKTMQPRFMEKGIQFFYKDEHYVYRIAKAVMEHLKDKN